VSAKLQIAMGAVLALALVAGFWALRAYYTAQGDAAGAARIQAAWDLQRANDSAAAEAERARRETLEREKERKAQVQAERIAHEKARREQDMQARVSAATAAERGLHTVIANQRAELAGLRAGAGADAGLAALAGQASTGAELLGQCASRYLAVATAADGLRDQVGGLQQFAFGACGAARPEGSDSTVTSAGPAHPAVAE
jgi:Cu/Zn superoxide dismutase